MKFFQINNKFLSINIILITFPKLFMFLLDIKFYYILVFSYYVINTIIINYFNINVKQILQR